jgi:ribosome maturation factor RimP
MGGVTIEQCATLSRAIESNLDRETEDFELEVSSAGLGQPFKVVQQYYKNVGKEIEVDLNDGSKMKGILEEVFDGGITLAEREPGKNSGNTKNLTEEGKKIEFKDIKSAKEVFTF